MLQQHTCALDQSRIARGEYCNLHFPFKTSAEIIPEGICQETTANKIVVIVLIIFGEAFLILSGLKCIAVIKPSKASHRSLESLIFLIPSHHPDRNLGKSPATKVGSTFARRPIVEAAFSANPMTGIS